MEKELKESMERYAALEAQLIENKKARMAVDRHSEEYAVLAEEGVKLRDAYIAEEKVRNGLVVKIEAEKVEG